MRIVNFKRGVDFGQYENATLLIQDVSIVKNYEFNFLVVAENSIGDEDTGSISIYEAKTHEEAEACIKQILAAYVNHELVCDITPKGE